MLKKPKLGRNTKCKIGIHNVNWVRKPRWCGAAMSKMSQKVQSLLFETTLQNPLDYSHFSAFGNLQYDFGSQEVFAKVQTLLDHITAYIAFTLLLLFLVFCFSGATLFSVSSLWHYTGCSSLLVFCFFLK